ncbi:MAG: outer membrane protein assembly factor BamB [Acidithiobacillus sp.]|nr:outer membrane protein assembly factor BamB [Acidithiobacillus sp.]
MKRHTSLGRLALHSLGVAGVLLSLGGCGVWNWAFGPSTPVPRAVGQLPKEKMTVSIHEDWQSRLYGDWRLDPYNAGDIAVTPTAIYLTDDSGHLLRLSKSGRQEWLYRLDGKSPRGPTVANGVVYVGTDRGKLYAISAKDGKKLWEVQLSAEVNSPITVAGDRLLLQLSNGHLLSVLANNGQIQWTYSVTQPSLLLRRTGGVLVHDQTVYAGFANGHLVALNLQNGAELWRATIAIPHGNNELARMVDVSATPVMDGDSVIAAAYQGNLASFAASGGSELWSRPLSVVLTPVLSGNVLFVASTDGQVYAIDARSGSVLWRNDALQGQSLSGMTICGNQLILSNYAGQVIVVDPKTGYRVGQRKISSSGIQSAPVCIAPDRFLVLSGQGTLYQLQLQDR